MVQFELPTPKIAEKNLGRFQGYHRNEHEGACVREYEFASPGLLP